MNTVTIGNCTLYHGKCEDILDHVDMCDHIVTDPPYGYLNHKIETYFDHTVVFPKLRNKIKPKGGILIFGRGDLFCEWNLYLRDLGFEHKEDCTLNKSQAPNAMSNFLRYGEYYTIRGLEGFTLNKVHIPVSDEDNVSDIQIVQWWRRASNNGQYRQEVINYLQTGEILHNQENTSRENICVNKTKMIASREVLLMKSLCQGRVMGNVLNSSRELLPDGMSHPTVKPSKEIGYLVEAMSNKGDVILDAFMGSGSHGVACINTQRKYIGIEKEKEYFDMSVKRIRQAYLNYQPSLFEQDIV